MDCRAATNRAVGRSGSLFAERYHAHVLKTRREVAHAIEYVLGNWFRHVGRDFGPWEYDKLSSAFEPSMVVRPQTWLLRVGWEAV